MPPKKSTNLAASVRQRLHNFAKPGGEELQLVRLSWAEARRSASEGISGAPRSVREKLTGTAARTLDLVYDDVSVEEMREALRTLRGRGSSGAPEGKR